MFDRRPEVEFRVQFIDVALVGGNNIVQFMGHVGLLVWVSEKIAAYSVNFYMPVFASLLFSRAYKLFQDFTLRYVMIVK